MSLEEKVGQMQNAAPAIPRLGVPAYDWWNEALHGVARAGAATVFPQAIGMAATFDLPLMHEVATAISDEARAKHHQFLRSHQHERYQGLTFWSPNINIFRDPRWGRGQETYGEDPFLTARMGVTFVQGLQGEGADAPKNAQGQSYRKLDATAKHFAVHSGPEADRHHFDARPSQRDLYETYLPAFEALVKDGKVDAVMGAYNRVYGASATASTFLLQDVLRQQWGFKGYVVSDCWAIVDIWKHHKIVATREQAAALAVTHGTELECGQEYSTLPAHDALARRTARESLVLLKNDGLLPLSRATLKRIAVIGPTADNIMALLGNYYGTPAAPVTVLQGIRNAAPNAQVLYERGADLVEGRDDPAATPLIEPQYLRPSANSPERGLRGEYFRNRALSGTPALVRVDAQIGFKWGRGSPTDNLLARGEASPSEAMPADNVGIRWRGQLLPPTTGTYHLEVAADDGVRLYLDGKPVIDRWTTSDRLHADGVDVRLQAGRAYDLRLDYFEGERDAAVRLAWRQPGAKPALQQALELARSAGVVIFVGGLTGDVEGEEMQVNYPGFVGGDRTDLRLPKPQRHLLEALHATGKPVVAVLTTGSALAIDWAQQHLPAILLAWYPGQRGGTAVADTLFGDANPGGRLPVTFYKESQTLPAFDDYAMRGRTYRYFEGIPLYPFGYGLSYTQFAYTGLRLDRDTVAADGSLAATVTVKNTGQRAGDEVVQLYLHPLTPQRERARKQLQGFQRIVLQPGEQRQLRFTINAKDALRIYDDQRKAYAVDPGAYEVQIGASSADIRATHRFTVTDH